MFQWRLTLMAALAVLFLLTGLSSLILPDSYEGAVYYNLGEGNTLRELDVVGGILLAGGCAMAWSAGLFWQRRMKNVLPDQPGTYALILEMSESTTIEVGKLGRFPFPSGWYVYLGSARGPGGLVARLARHRRLDKTPHWHVDYLRAQASLFKVWYAIGEQKRECAWAQKLLEFPDASIIAPHFGASDCKCPAHLIHFTELPDLAAFRRAVGESVFEEKFEYLL